MVTTSGALSGFGPGQTTTPNVFDEAFQASKQVQRMLTSILSDFDKPASFPPYEVVRFKADEEGVERFAVRIAAAGYSEDDITIQQVDNNLFVGAVDIHRDEKSEEILHNGFARRAWKRSFALGQGVEVDEAEFNDGVLTIHLHRVVEDNTKFIKIKKSKKTLLTEGKK